MGLHLAELGTCTIPTSAGAVSNILGAKELGMAQSIVFYSPATYTGTISVEVGLQEDAGAAAMAPFYSGGSAVTLTAGRAERFEVNGFRAVRLKTSGTEGASRAVPIAVVLDLPDGG